MEYVIVLYQINNVTDFYVTSKDDFDDEIPENVNVITIMVIPNKEALLNISEQIKSMI